MSTVYERAKVQLNVRGQIVYRTVLQLVWQLARMILIILDP